MANKFKRISIKKSKKKVLIAGASPGSIQVSEGALKPQITVYSFSIDLFQEVSVSGFKELKDILTKYKGATHWIDVKGLGDIELFQEIKNEFEISALIIEDILHTHQRPKLEEFNNYLFATSRMICMNAAHQLENEQISFLVTDKLVFTFQENYEDCLEPVRKRLREGKGTIRIGGSSYLMYAIMDLILDNYFLLINRFGEDLETIEECLHNKTQKSITDEIQQIKRALITIRRAAWPERDKLNDMIRSDSPLITANTKTFLRDVYDHSMQVIDLVESYKEITNSLLDMYHSLVSNRTNEVMRILTVVSSIFIPLTFIAGVYGMNFAYQHPQTGRILNKNMPELYSENGYLYTIGAMTLIAFIQLIYFWRKGWLK